MPDSKIVAMVCIVGSYGIYCLSNPGADGFLFGSIMLALGALAGVKLTEVVRQ